MEASERQYEPGWYDYYGGQRFWDGETWTEHMTPPPPPAQAQAPDLAPAPQVEQRKPLGFAATVLAVALGGILAWAAVYGGAQLAPDDIYFPIKVVVETANLPDLTP